MQSLLFVDRLGVRATWHDEGRIGAERAFGEMRSLLIESLQEVAEEGVVSAGLETDSLAVICKNPRCAIRLGRALFRNGFRRGNSASERRVWLRGVIVPSPETAAVRVDKVFVKPNVVESVLAPALLDAIAAEKSGFCGMRLLLSGALPAKGAQGRYRVMLSQTVTFNVVRRLNRSAYPSRLHASRFSDILWMVSDTEEEWAKLRAIMANRMRLAFADVNELVHAGATQAVFNSCGGLIGSMLQKGRMPQLAG